MEKKTTQRMIGVLVVAALIVIMLPLIFNGSTTQATSQTAEVKAPPFPDQASMDQANNQSASDVNASGSINISQDTANAINNTTTPAVATTTAATEPAAAPAAPVSNDPSIEIKGQPAAPALTASATPAEPVAAAPVAPAVAATPAPAVSEIAAVTTPAVAPTPEVVAPPVATTVVPVVEAKIQKAAAVVVEPKHVKKAIVAAKLSHADLVKLKSAAWAVQMGSFKVKNNAERLANQLRAQGYKAFTREIRSSTRVYIGPEFRQASASSLAQKLEQNLNMRGIVVPYQPLEL